MYDYGHRLYSPDLGRWINRDPIGEQGGLNLYAFVRNNGVNRGDSFGLSPWEGVWETLLYGKHCSLYEDWHLESKKRVRFLRDKLIQMSERIIEIVHYAYRTGDIKELIALKSGIRYNEEIWLEETETAWRLKGEYDKCRCAKNGFYCRTISGVIGAGADAAGLLGGGAPAMAAGVINGFVTAMVCGEESHSDVLQSTAFGLGSAYLEGVANNVIKTKAKELLIDQAEAASLSGTAKALKGASILSAGVSIYINLKPVVINIYTELGPIFFAGKDRPEDADTTD